MDDETKELLDKQKALLEGVSLEERREIKERIITQFHEAFKHSALDDFKRRDIEAIYHKLKSLDREANRMKKKIAEALELFEPISPYPFKTTEQYSDVLESLDPDEVPDGKGN